MGAKIEVYRGDHYIRTLTFKDSSKDAIDITSYTVFFTVKTNKTDSDDNALIKKTITSHTDATNGITTLTLTDSDTDLAIGTHYYDIQIKDGSGNIITLTDGEFEIKQDITTRTS